MLRCSRRALSVSQATVSHHIKELADAGLVESRCEGQFKYLRACPDVLAEYVRQLNERIGFRSGAANIDRPAVPAAEEQTVSLY